nr:macro domain-containing protein [Halorubrum yunnanense]
MRSPSPTRTNWTPVRDLRRGDAHYGDGRATPESVGEATRNALAAAEERGCESLVVPVLGTGAAALEFETGARRVCEAIDAQEPTTLRDVRVIAYSTEELRTVEAVAKRVHSRRW